MTDEWVMVPMDPTPEMVTAGREGRAAPFNPTRDLWRAMLAAAPAAPQQADAVAWMAFGGSIVHAVTRNAMDPIEAERFDVPLYLHPPADEVQRLRAAALALLNELDAGRHGAHEFNNLRNALRGHAI